jgi:hypothetical protein
MSCTSCPDAIARVLMKVSKYIDEGAEHGTPEAQQKTKTPAARASNGAETEIPFIPRDNGEDKPSEKKSGAALGRDITPPRWRSNRRWNSAARSAIFRMRLRFSARTSPKLSKKRLSALRSKRRARSDSCMRRENS